LGKAFWSNKSKEKHTFYAFHTFYTFHKRRGLGFQAEWAA
jgi:hypothetical protein